MEGGIPTRAHGAIDGLVRGLLEECWNKTPQKRPPIVRVYRTLKSRLKSTRTPRRRPTAGKLPGALELHVQSIKFSSYQEGRPQFYAKFKYGNEDYTTSPTDLQNYYYSGECTWFVFQPFLPLLPPLSPTQGWSGRLADRNG